jgi:hypothetical protein
MDLVNLRGADDVLLPGAGDAAGGLPRSAPGCCAARPATTGRRSATTRRPRRRSASTSSATRCYAVLVSSAMTALAGCVLRLLLQQPVPRADLQHQPLDRDHPGADHRRHRHAVRPDPRRLRADAAGRRHQRWCSKVAGRRFPASSRSSTAWALMVVIMFMPNGIWPDRCEEARNSGGARMTVLLDVRGVSKRFRGLKAVTNVQPRGPQGEIVAADRPQRRRQDDAVQHDRRRDRAGFRLHPLPASAHRRRAPDELCRRGMAAPSRSSGPSPTLTVLENAMVGAMMRAPDMDAARAVRRRGAAPLDLWDRRDCQGEIADAARPQASRMSPARWPPSRACCCSTRSWPACARPRSTAWSPSSATSTAQTASPSC